MPSLPFTVKNIFLIVLLVLFNRTIFAVGVSDDIAGAATAISAESSQPVQAPAQNQAQSGSSTTLDDEMILIPAGEFIMGSNKVDTSKNAGEFGNAKPWYLDEHPEHKVRLDAFYIDKYEVTNGQYRKFITTTKRRPPEYWVFNGYLLSMSRDRLYEQDVEKLRKLVSKVFQLDINTRTMTKEQLLDAVEKRFAAMDYLPVVYVSWNDAVAYCESVGKRLPTEAEWEKAARGENGNEFVWGNEWTIGVSNTGEELWDDGVAPVGSYPGDKSVYGVFDMAGNVSEWVNDWYQPYPDTDYTSKDFGEHFKVIRGSAWGGEGHYALKLFQRGAYRFYLEPESYHDDLGFRCAKDFK